MPLQYDQPRPIQKKDDNKQLIDNKKASENGLEVVQAKKLRVPATTDLSTLGLSISDSNNTDNIGRGYLFFKMSSTQQKLQSLFCVLEVLECILDTYEYTHVPFRIQTRVGESRRCSI